MIICYGLHNVLKLKIVRNIYFYLEFYNKIKKEMFVATNRYKLTNQKEISTSTPKL